MTNLAAGLLPVLVYVGTVLGSLPVALTTYGLGRWLGSTALALRYVGAGLAGPVLAGAAALAAFVDPVAGVLLVAFGAAAALVLAAFPLVIGRQLLGRWTTLPPDEALEYAVLGWPVALAASLVVFLVPGGPERYNATFLTGPAAALAWTAIGLVVTLGPGAVGFGMHRLVEWLR